jgi:hypothetical protein
MFNVGRVFNPSVRARQLVGRVKNSSYKGCILAQVRMYY